MRLPYGIRRRGRHRFMLNVCRAMPSFFNDAVLTRYLRFAASFASRWHRMHTSIVSTSLPPLRR